MSAPAWKKILASPTIQRSSQTVTIAKDHLFIYGGELTAREPVDSNVYAIKLSDTNGVLTRVDSEHIARVQPEPRVGTASTALDGKLYLFSGRGGVSMAPLEELGAIWMFDTDSSAWSLLRPHNSSRPYPSGRSYHAIANDGISKIFLHAGCPEKGRLNDLWSFDVSTLEWTELEPAPGPPRGGTSIAFSNNLLYRINGFDGKTELGGAMDVYDPRRNVWQSITYDANGTIGPTPRSVSCLLAVEISDKPCLVTLFGERDPSSAGHAGAGKMLGDVWKFDIHAKTWTQLVFTNTQAPAPRGWFDADVYTANHGKEILVHGGLSESNERLDDVWSLSFRS